jgi:hypothetical protein
VVDLAEHPRRGGGVAALVQFPLQRLVEHRAQRGEVAVILTGRLRQQVPSLRRSGGCHFSALLNIARTVARCC